MRMTYSQKRKIYIEKMIDLPYTRVLPISRLKTISNVNTLMTQNEVAQFYGVTPSAVGHLAKVGILHPRYIFTEENSDRVVTKRFASADVDFVQSCKQRNGEYDLDRLTAYWTELCEIEGVVVE